MQARKRPKRGGKSKAVGRPFPKEREGKKRKRKIER